VMELRTELAFASDGKIYINMEEGRPPGRRRVFVGYALTSAERIQRGPRGLLEWALTTTLALGTDGRIYVAEGEIEAEGRPVFRGYAASKVEATRLFDAIHRSALDFTFLALRVGLGGRPRTRG